MSDGEEDDDINNSKIHSEGEKDGWVENSGAMKKPREASSGKHGGSSVLQVTSQKGKSVKQNMYGKQKKRKRWRTNGNLYIG